MTCELVIFFRVDLTLLQPKRSQSKGILAKGLLFQDISRNALTRGNAPLTRGNATAALHLFKN